MLALLINLNGCSSSELTRRQVKKMIAGKLKGRPFPPQTLFISYGHAKRDYAGKYCDEDVFVPFLVQEAKKGKLDIGGIVTLTELVPCGDWDVSLTPAAQTVLVGKPTPAIGGGVYQYVRLADWNSYEITGITQDGPRATVNFARHYTLTPVGVTYFNAGGSIDGSACFPQAKELVCTDSEQFTRFDDGWRFGGDTQK